MYVKMSQYQSFFISASGNSSQCDEINHFLRSHVVIRTVENIINSGSNCGIQILVEYKDVQQSGEKTGRQKIDLRASLATDEQHELFDRLKIFPKNCSHHAIMNVLEPAFERQFIFHTYACRKGKGTHAAARCLELLFGVIDSYKIDFEGDAAARKKVFPLETLQASFLQIFIFLPLTILFWKN